MFAGLLPWTFFANAVSAAGQSVVGSERLITKVYFPRLIIPIGGGGGRAGRPPDRLRHARGTDGLLRRRAGVVICSSAVCSRLGLAALGVGSSWRP